MADNQFIARKGLISLDDSQITGSLSITNAVTASVFTGSFRGDGTNLYNIPSSGVTGLNLDKIISGSVSASISPNNGFRINTDVYIDGTITAKEFHTDYVTSSVLYQSGSTKFGDTLDDLHEFTGSVRITGSITLNGQAIGTGKLDETTFNSYTSSISSSIGGLSSSITTLSSSLSGSIDSLSSSVASINNTQNGRLDSLETASGSIRTNFNTFTSSYNTGSFTGSFIGDGSQLTGIDGFPFTGSAKITGSLAVTGSLTVDGNVNATSFTGSIQGTATTASYVNLTNVDGFTAYSSSVSSSINSVLNATTPVTATVNNTNSPFTITNQTIAIVDSTNGNVTVNLPDLNTVVGTPNQRPIIIYKNDYSQNVVFVEPNGSQLVNGTTQDIIVSIQIGIVYNPTSAGWVTEGTSYQSLAELELFFVPRTETGSLSVSTASYVEYTNVANKPSLVSGSSQISFNGITDKPTLVSGSSQIIYSGLTGIPSGIVSGSSQVAQFGYATTGSNVFVGSQVITGSLYITTDLIVQGSSSLQNITASAVSIGTNTVILNTDTPAVRFAGISVQDSGSNAGVTGSIFWDGLCNRWVYSNPSGIGYSGGMLLSGPRTQTLGTEPTLTCNYIAKSGGGDHLYDSCIIDDGTTTCIKNNLMAGVGNFSGCLTFGDWTSATNVLTSNKPNEQGAYIRAAVSTAEYPTYTFEDDRDTGMYRDGANSLGFTTSGSARMTISSTGDALFNGNIILQGASSSRICLIKDYSGSPSNTGFVISNTSGGVTFSHNANGGGTNIGGVTCLGSNFCVAGASYFAGNVGIAAIPTGWGSNVNAIELPQAVSLYSWNASAVPQLYLGANHYWDGSNWRYKITGQLATLYYQANGQHQWFNAPSGTAGCVISFCQSMTLNASGNIGIGTTSNLTSGAYSSIRLGTIANWWAGNSAGSGDFYLQGNSYYDGSSLRYIRTDAATEYSQVSGFHAWSTAASGTAGCSITMVERMRISNTGLVGIGTINPDYNLVICCSGQVIANVRTNSTTAGSESGILITTPDSIGLLTVGASSGRGVNDAARCDMVMGLRTGGKIRFTTDINANTTHITIANGITSFTCQMCAPYAIFNGTAAVTLPVGTTAQRTGPSTGMIRFNSSCTELEYYNGNDWLFFTSTPQSQGYYADVLVIAGGGGGGGAEASNGYGGGGAGGGAGGYSAGRIFINYTNCGYPISIGAGGTGGANNPQATGSGCNGTMGTASCALGLIAIGGGFGGGDETGTNAGNGGSGGGQGGDNTGTQGCGTLGQGCAGGYANTRNGGGGGGASTTGCHGYGGTGAGGQGRAWYNGTTYAGGGGGGNGAAVNTTTFGGAGGGGNGSATDGTSGNQVAGGTATAGTANTGGGGGGGAAGRAQGGQNGGSGIVIVRYYGSQKGFGGTITSSGGYTYHSFTSSGTYCATYY